MWCNLGKSVWSPTCGIFSFLFDWSAHLKRYILLKTPPESHQWFQSYDQLKDSQNNRKQKKCLFLAISHNQCSWLLTDSARSQHKCVYVRRNNCFLHKASAWNTHTCTPPLYQIHIHNWTYTCYQLNCTGLYILQKIHLISTVTLVVALFV